MKGAPRRGKHPMRPVLPGRLRALRLAAGLTQHALARSLGVSVQAVWLLDNDKRQPSLALVRKLKRVLGQMPRQDAAIPPTVGTKRGQGDDARALPPQATAPAV